MTARQIPLWVAQCDGCGRELGAGYGHRETYDTRGQAMLAARVSTWTVHPDGSMYCDKGEHQ